ncbi:MAG: GC-type dockerin domain-anchored protein [Planctomycetota bacterium]
MSRITKSASDRAVCSRLGLLGVLALGTVAAAGAAASADECCRWELRVQRKAILSDNFEVELWAHFPDSGHAFGGGRVDILTDGVDWISGDYCGLGPPVGGSVGQVVGDDVLDIAVGQLHFPIGGIFADTDNPILVWCGEFEASGDGYRTIETQTDSFSYYPDADSAVSNTCTPIEADRTVFVGPLVIDDWIASPFPGVGGDIVKDGLELFPLPGGPGEIGVGLQADDSKGDKMGNFEIQHLMSTLDPAASLDLTWYPLPWCFWIDPWITLGLTTPRRGELDIVPNFRGVGATTVPIVAFLDGKEAGRDAVPAGGSFKIFDPCTSLTWCWIEDDDGWPVLVLKCDSPFDIQIGSTRVRADSIRMQPAELRGAPIDLDRVEVRGRGLDRLVIEDAGVPDATSCFADCNGDGRLNIFDFLCFQNLFSAGDLAADCNGDGRLNIFDFLCFQNAFADGCP